MGSRSASCSIALLAGLVAHCGASDDTGLFGAGGDSGAAGQGATGAVSGNAGVGGFGGVGGFSGVGGLDASSDSVAGSGGSGGDTGGSGGNCEYCADTDGDGHGDPNERRTSCDPGAGWVTICDDCHDQNAEVFPGATTCRSTPYTPVGGGTPSFDYDCSGSASECAEVAKAGNCAIMGVGCSGSGYVQNSQAADTGVASPFCGSTQYRVCNRITVIFCTPSNETRAAVECL